MTLGSIPIEQIVIPIKCRDEFPHYLRAMKYVYMDKKLSEQIFKQLESIICTKKATGRKGMDLWTIFVLAGARLCLNADYDHLHYRANHDLLLRQMLGVHDGIIRGREFEYQTIIDNVSLLDDDSLRKINELIVSSGHKLVKKKETEALRIKIDSFVVESDVHFPTDYNLLFDSARKSLDLLKHLIHSDCACSDGWRKIEHWRGSIKREMLVLSRVTSDKSKNRQKRLNEATEQYLRTAGQLSDKLHNIKLSGKLSMSDLVLLEQLEYFRNMLDKHIDLLDRRLLQGEKIPHEEKIFSVFEPWVEWICKGKAHKPVELGKRTLIATDQWHLAIDWWVADHQQDNQLLLPALDRIRERYQVSGCSSDKGFFSKEDIELMELFDIKAFISKKGKCSASDLQRENDPEFIKAKRKHSAVESNINELEHRGLDRCPDKGIRGMHRYVGLAVIAYNLRRIGKMLLDQEKKELDRKAVKHRRAA